MSAKRTLEALTCGILLGSGGLVCADEKDMPDMEFLEYLGMWEESDEDWLILDEAMTAGNNERSDPVPKGEESMETEDER
ncbi:MAG: hypothetical protein KJO01_00105 [Gammaproteobacteria bacterium]|nr:hypothetical protein [Gammaproteobacteria bacterium]MBT8109559.1 hypothetical protein [Gammaproteobacteria bacterium]NND46152.1 hypothetical protein [Woeseiaceae bacterium]NNL44261.1 hypothetical protein [Woeseiaceae bacterium]